MLIFVEGKANKSRRVWKIFLQTELSESALFRMMVI